MSTIKKALALGAAALTLAGVGVAASTGAASADTGYGAWSGGSVTLDVPDVRYDADSTCQDMPFTVDVETPPDYYYADYDFTATYDGPTDWPVSTYEWGSYSGHYDESWLICTSSDLPGSYTGTVTVTFYDEYYNQIDSATATDPFKISAHAAPASTAGHTHVVQHRGSMTTAKSFSGRHGWALTSTYRLDGGVRSGVRVDLQRKDFGQWHTVQRRWTTGSGQARFSFTPRGDANHGYRTVAAANHGVGSRTSRIFWLHRR